MASWQNALAAQAAKIWSFGTVKPPLPEATREIDPQAFKEAVKNATGGRGRFSRVPLYDQSSAAAAVAGPEEDEREEVAFLADEPPAPPWPRRLADALLFEPVDAGALGPGCAVVYCPSGRGMNASAAEAISLAKRLLPLGVAVLAIDPTVDGRRAACRLRDLEAALELLRGANGAGGLGYARVALWGRSAGAAVALRYVVKVPALVALVCDSPHCDLEPLAPAAGAPLPQSVMQWLAATAPATCGGIGQGTLPGDGADATVAAVQATAAREELEKELQLPPSRAVEQCFAPALFIHGRRDATAPPSHTQALREAYAGEREPVLWVPDGTHDSRRPAATLAKAALFLLRQFCLDEKPELREAVERLASAAASTQEALPVSPQLLASDAEVCRLLNSSNQVDKRRGLFLAALAACPSHRSTSFSQVTTPARWSQEEPLLQATAMATLPRRESEVVVAWATDFSQGAGAVYFAVLSATLASLTAVELLPAREGEAGTFAGLTARVQPLAITEVSLGHGLAPHPVELHMSPNGAIEMFLGDAHLEASSDSAAAWGGCIRGVSLWRGMQVAPGDVPVPVLEFIPPGSGLEFTGRGPQLPRVHRHPAPAAPPGASQVTSPGGMRSLLSAGSFLTPQGSLSLTLSAVGHGTPSERSCRATVISRPSPAASPARRPSPADSPTLLSSAARGALVSEEDASPKPSAPLPSPPRTPEEPLSPPSPPVVAEASGDWATAAGGELPSEVLAALGVEGGQADVSLLGQCQTWPEQRRPGAVANSDAPPHAATWGAPGDL